MLLFFQSCNLRLINQNPSIAYINMNADFHHLAETFIPFQNLPNWWSRSPFRNQPNMNEAQSLKGGSYDRWSVSGNLSARRGSVLSTWKHTQHKLITLLSLLKKVFSSRQNQVCFLLRNRITEIFNP